MKLCVAFALLRKNYKFVAQTHYRNSYVRITYHQRRGQPKENLLMKFLVCLFFLYIIIILSLPHVFIFRHAKDKLVIAVFWMNRNILIVNLLAIDKELLPMSHRWKTHCFVRVHLWIFIERRKPLIRIWRASNSSCWRYRHNIHLTRHFTSELIDQTAA